MSIDLFNIECQNHDKRDTEITNLYCVKRLAQVFVYINDTLYLPRKDSFKDFFFKFVN